MQRSRSEPHSDLRSNRIALMSVVPMFSTRCVQGSCFMACPSGMSSSTDSPPGRWMRAFPPVMIEVEVDGNVGAAQTVPDHIERALDDLIERHRRPRFGLAPRHGQEGLDDARAALCGGVHLAGTLPCQLVGRHAGVDGKRFELHAGASFGRRRKGRILSPANATGVSAALRKPPSGGDPVGSDLRQVAVGKAHAVAVLQLRCLRLGVGARRRALLP